MEPTMNCPAARLAGLLSALLTSAGLVGCSDRPGPNAPAAPTSHRIAAFRVIKFAGEKVVVPFREGPPPTPLPEPRPGEGPPKPGDRVVLGGPDPGEVFLAGDLEALKFYHSTPGPGQLGRFRLLGDEGRLFVVARGTVGSVLRVVDGELPGGLKAIELKGPGEDGGTAWVGDPFVRRIDD